MLLLINSVQTAIDADKNLALLKTSKADLSSLNSMFVSGLPKLTLSQRLSEKGGEFIKRLDPRHPSTEHVIYKERIAEILGRSIYHAAKVKGCIKDRLKNLSDADFVRLQTRCDKIRSPQYLLGVFTEIMHEGRRVPLLKEQQLERLLSSWPELKNIIDKGVQTFKQEVANQKVQLKEKVLLREEQLFVIQTLYDLSSESNITPEKWNSMDKVKKARLFSVISEGNISSCLEKRIKFQKTLFTESSDKEKLKKLKEAIFQSVKDDLYCLEYSSVSTKAN